MRGIETGKDKVKKICEVLKRETLEPAIQEAEVLLEEARVEAEKIIGQAEKKAAKMVREAELEIERQKNVFHSSLAQAYKQTFESLKQAIEDKLFNHQLSKTLSGELKHPKVVAQLITAIVEALKRDGIEADLSAAISAAVDPRVVNELLARDVLDRLREKSVILGEMAAGVEIKLHHEKMTLDMTDTALKELLNNYLRKDFQDLIFAANS